MSLASACLGDPILGDDGSSTSSDSGSSGTTLASSSGTDGSFGTSGTSTDGATAGTTAETTDGDTSDTGPLVCEPLEGLQDIPAILEVTVEILNDTAEPVYVLEWFEYCTPYAMTRDGLNLPIVFGFSCPCECGPPEIATGAIALEPGQSLVLTWDGRVLVFFPRNVHCKWKDQDGVKEWCERDTTAVSQPLAPGPITMTIPIYDEEGYYGQSSLETYELPICGSPRSFSVDFELGTEDLTIPIALSEVVIQRA